MSCHSRAEVINGNEPPGKEHDRLAEQLHDGVMQLLVALRFNARSLGLEAARLSIPARAHLRDIESLSDRALSELSSLVHALESGTDLQRGETEALVDRSRSLAGRIERLTEAFSAQTGIDCRLLAMEDHLRCPHEVADVIYRSVAELLNNVEKHAGASSVTIRTDRRDDQSIVITVSDDGDGAPGFNGSRPPDTGDGFGLFSIRNRIRQIGGDIGIDGRHGFTVRLIVPPRKMPARTSATVT